MIEVAIVGAAGYAGAELLSILLKHPGVRVVGLFGSERSAGKGEAPADIADSHPAFRGLCHLSIQPASVEGIVASGASVVFLCTPHAVSHDLAPALLEAGRRVFDLSASFRFADTAVYPKHYGLAHAHPDLAARAVYGLCELFRERLRTADLVGVPGCYPTSVILPVNALVRAGAIDGSRRVVVDAISGISGAGRSPQQRTLFCEVSVQPYEVLKHRHTPEMEAYSGARVYFTPQVGPYDRGIVSTIHADLAPGWTVERARAALEGAYGSEAFVRLLPEARWPSVAGVKGTNFCDIGVGGDDAGRHLVIVSAIDNLVKGAAGQAVQCMNIRHGLPEGLGLLPGGGVPSTAGVTA